MAIGRLQRLDLDPGAAEPRLRLFDGDLVWHRVDPKQELTLADALIVLDADFNDLAGNPSIDRFLCRANEGVVCPNKWLTDAIFGGSAKSQREGERDQERAT